jgi:hypothetical protein
MLAVMRGDDQQLDRAFSYISPDQRVPQDHPLRPSKLLQTGYWSNCRGGSASSMRRDIRFRDAEVFE